MTDLLCEISHKILSYNNSRTNGEQYTGSLEDLLEKHPFIKGDYVADELLSFAATPEQDEAAMELGDALVQHPGFYQIGSNNCADVALKIADAAGVKLKAEKLTFGPTLPKKTFNANRNKGQVRKSKSWQQMEEERQKAQDELREDLRRRYHDEHEE